MKTSREKYVPHLFIISLKLFQAHSRNNLHLRRRTQQEAGCHHSAKYHSHMTRKSTCTNDDVYPAPWDQPPMSERFFFDTAEACCEFYFQGFDNCDVINACGDTFSSEAESTSVSNSAAEATLGPYTYPEDSACHGRKWHPDTTSLISTCTNNPHYPASWDNGMMDGITMFTNPNDCCEMLKSTSEDGQCVIDEDPVCRMEAASPTSRPTTVSPTKDLSNGDCTTDKWHPDIEFKGCTNSPSGTYPVQWDQSDMASRYLYESYEACCNTFFRNKDCAKMDVCYVVPQDCSTLKWHPSTDFKSCTNNLEYPSAWELSSNQNMYLLNSADDCCSAFFSGQHCPKDDLCNTIPCEEQLWHPSNDFKKCSNSLEYPSSWNLPPGYDQYMFSSFEECCEGFFSGQLCPPKDDVCSPQSTLCEDQMWHPTTDFKTCTNGLDYPSDWNVSPAYDNFMHDSSEECCSKFFDGKPCPLVDECNPQSTICEDQMWHPTTDFKTCTNSNDYPASWSQPPMSDNYLHDSYEECCADLFVGKDCPKVDVCTTPAISDSTEGPSQSKSSAMPSLTPTSNQPTFPPTSGNPTASPIDIECITAKWHPGEDGYCSNSLVYNSSWDRPALSETYFHDTHASCCRQFYNETNCGTDDICAGSFPNSTPVPTQTPSTLNPTIGKAVAEIKICKLKKFHPISVVDRRCTNDNHIPPLWNILPSTYFFASAAECCDSFYNDDGSGSCETQDVCVSADRVPIDTQDCNKKWHPISENNRVCSNGDKYPSVWNSMPDKFFFNTAHECCEAFYSEGSGQCDVLNTCSL